MWNYSIEMAYDLKKKSGLGSLYSHFLHGVKEMFLPFPPISPHFYSVILNSFPNKLYYYFYYKKRGGLEMVL
jgi:hypothetical protein